MSVALNVTSQLTSGAFGQQMEFRAGHITNGAFVDAPGGQLVHARATDSDIVEHISTAETSRHSASRSARSVTVSLSAWPTHTPE